MEYDDKKIGCTGRCKVIDASINYLNDDDDADGKIWKRFNG